MEKPSMTSFIRYSAATALTLFLASVAAGQAAADEVETSTSTAPTTEVSSALTNETSVLTADTSSDSQEAATEQDVASATEAAKTPAVAETAPGEEANEMAAAESTAEVAETATAEASVTTGFHSDDQGNWYYADQNGQNVTGLQEIDGVQLYFDETGVQAKGKEVTIDNKTYFFDVDNGQLWTNRFREYTTQSYVGISSSGLVYETRPAWKYYGADGAMVTGPQIIDGVEYYFDSNGQQVKGSFVTDTTTSIEYYYDAETGAKAYNNWAKKAGYTRAPQPSYYVTYYLGENGQAVTGVQEIDGKLYLFTNDGKLLIGRQGDVRYAVSTTNGFTYQTLEQPVIYNGQAYVPDINGELVANTFFTNRFVENNGNWYYLGSDGQVLKGSQTIDGVQLYFDKTGVQAKGKEVTIDDKTYFFDADTGAMWTNRFRRLYTNRSYDGTLYEYWGYHGTDGALVTGAQTIDGVEMYFSSNGVQYKGQFLKNADGSIVYYDKDSGALARNAWGTVTVIGSRVKVNNRYYFNQDGQAVTGVQEIDGKLYLFTNDGKLLIGRQDDVRYAVSITNGFSYQTLEQPVIYKGQAYVPDINGELVANTFFKNRFVTQGNSTYYLDEDGAAVTNQFVEVNGSWYYFGADGKAATGAQTINGQNLYFNADGKQVKGGTDPDGNFYDANTGERA